MDNNTPRRSGAYMQSSRRQILVINGKGGCGKTTIATNLAVTYACKRKNVILIDNDPQASSTAWANIRSTKMPPVTTTPRYERLSMYQTQSFQNRLPNETDIVIVDGNSNARGRDLDDILKDTDIILIPMLPSAIDIRASGRFIADLLTHRLYRAAPRPVGVIANRVNTMNKTYNKLMQFLSCLDVPVVAQFNDSTLYTDAAEQGLGVIEMADDSAAPEEAAQWRQLMHWIDQQATSQPSTAANLRLKMRPRAATRKKQSNLADQA